jgi:acyl-CoA thioester hydrolase
MSFFNSKGYGITNLVKQGFVPVILKENFTFYKELFVEQIVFVTLELTAVSEDGNIFECTHKIYDSDGVHHATSLVQGVWIDMIQRKRISPPNDLQQILLESADKNKLRILTIEDIKDKEKPVNLEPEFLKNNYYIHA